MSCTSREPLLTHPGAAVILRYKTRIWLSGRTVFLGSHFYETDAARAYDRVSINRSGAQAVTNFPLAEYDVDALMATPLAELVAEQRGQASGTRVELQPAPARPPKAVSRHKQSGKWAARLQVGDQKVFLGLFDTEAEACAACEAEAHRWGVPASAGQAASLPDILGISDVPSTPRVSSRRITPSVRARGVADDDAEWTPAKKARHAAAQPRQHSGDGKHRGHHAAAPDVFASGDELDGAIEQAQPLSPRDAAVTLLQLHG